MKNDIIRVEVDQFGQVERIFRTVRAAVSFSLEHPHLARTMSRSEAVEIIRRRVYARSAGACEFGGEPITWNTMHMHERQSRGKGGEISVSNSVALCADCHLNREHSDRKWGGRGE